MSVIFVLILMGACLDLLFTPRCFPALRCSSLLLVCLERKPEFFKAWLAPEIQDKIIYLSEERNESEFCQGKDSVLDRVVPYLRDGATGVVIDSLTIPLTSMSAAHTCTLLHTLATDKRVAQVVVMLHRDVHDKHIFHLVQHAASSTVHIQPRSTAAPYVCDVCHCNPTGKVSKTRESFAINDKFCIQDIGPAPQLHSSSTTMVPMAQSDPAAHLPFNLSLTDHEKTARSQVRLPYLKDSANPEPSSGLILYQPDDTDDFDEEDPDDDLNI